jgi:hypothetical protein
MRVIPQSELSSASSALEKPLVFPSRARVGGNRPASKPSQEGLARALFISLVAVAIVEALFHAVTKALWFDEILTVLVSSQWHLTGMWDLLKHGVDGHPLGIYVVEHLIAKLGGNDRITYRLAPIAAFVCVMVCMHVFIRRRAGRFVALVAVPALLLTNLYDPFAFEARPYGLMVACIAFAFLCYERANSWKWAALFALSLAAASSLHFYAAISFFPFALAEIVIVATVRRFRPQVWLAFLAGMLPYLAFWPILNAQRVFYGAHFWATPTFWRFAISMAELLRSGMGFSVAVFAAAIISLGYFAYSGKIGAGPSGAFGTGFSLPDIALALGFLAIPVVTFAAAKIGHGGYTSRYAITATLGIVLALSIILSRLERPVVMCVGLFLLCMFVFQEAGAWSFAFAARGVKDPIQSPLQMAEKLNIPLVVSDELEFLPIWYGADNEFRMHLVFLADAQEQYSVWGTDSATIQMQKLKDYFPVRVQSFSEFAQNNSRFLLLSNGGGRDYRPRWLVNQGYSVQVIDIDPPIRNPVDQDILAHPKEILYLVDLDERK